MDITTVEGNAMRPITVLITAIFLNIIVVGRGYSQTNKIDLQFAFDSQGAVKTETPTVIIIVGAAGAAEYGTVFTQSAELWQKAASKGNAKSMIIGLDESSDDRTLFKYALKNEPNETDSALWLVLIGHGTYDGRTAKFNLRGSDFSGEDLAEWLKPFNRPIIIINTTSSSAPFLNKLSAENRVVITATRSGYELNYTRFGRYLADSIIEPQADLDKDGQTSLLEAFLSASNRVAEFYSAQGRLATEHALLDDNGDGLGTPADWFRGIRPVKKARDNTTLDGYRAHQFCLVRSETENKMPPQLRVKRDELELEVIKLRDMKENFSEEEYFTKLEKLLHEMAKIYEQIDKTDKNSL
jgi:hypothetical protein